MKTALEEFIEKFSTEWVYGAGHLKKLGMKYMRKEKEQILDAFRFGEKEGDVMNAETYFKNRYDWESREKKRYDKETAKYLDDEY